MKKKKSLIIIVLIVMFVIILGTFSYAFMRYLNIGDDNTFILGDVAFTSSYTAQSKNMVYPIPASTIETDNDNTAKVTVSIQGTTHYSTGMTYRVILDDFTNDLGGNMEGPVSIVVTANNLPGVEITSYDTQIFGHTGDVIASGNIPAGTSVDGTVSITAFVNSDLVVISDNYYNKTGLPRKVIFGTDDWNTFATETGLTFRVRVEAETIAPPPTYVPPVRECTYDGSMVKGATFTDGQYTYKYLQENDAYYYNSVFYDEWYDVADGIDGWGVKVTDRNATDDIITPLCTTINNKPIVAMSGMFAYSKAKYVDTSSFDTSNVYVMYAMFCDSQIEDVDLSHFNTSNVQNFNYMFDSSKIKKLDLSSFDTSSARMMMYMFSSVNNPVSFDISSFDTSNVTNMEGMFYYANIPFLDLRNFDTSNVTNMSSMFLTPYLRKFYISNFDTSNVTNMEGMFREINVDKLYLHGLDTSKVETMEVMFMESNVPEINLNSFDTTSLDDICEIFDSGNFQKINIKHFDTSNVSDFSWAFTEVTYDDLDLSYMDVSGATDMRGMFWGASFDSLDLSGWDTSHVTDMRQMFREADIQTINLSSFNTSAVTNMSEMFKDSTVRTIYVSNNWTTNAVTTSTNMFSGTTHLVGGANTTYLTSNPKDKTYARIDNAPTTPGYFTYRNY